MIKPRAWVAGLSLAFLAGACATGETDGTGTGGSNGVAGQGPAGSTGQGVAGQGPAGSTGQGVAGQSPAGSTGQGVAGQGDAGSPGVGGSTGVAGSSPAGVGGSTAGKGGSTGVAGAGPAGSTGQAGSGPGGSGDATLPRAATSTNGTWTGNVAVTVVTSGTVDVTVNDTSVKQNWDGFGGAFNEMGWAALQALSATDRATALNLLFGPDGARFLIGRIPMGASDYACDDITKYPNCDKAKSRYSLDDTSGDTALTNFSISRDMKALIPYVKAAQAIRPTMHFWSSPWTPPPWMKSKNSYDGGTMKSDDATLKAYAQYFVKFVQAYAQQQITVEAVSPQNEPNFEQTYPSCLWGTDTFVKFIPVLGQAFTTANVTATIMLGTMSNSDPDSAIVSAVMSNASAKSYVKSVGMQWGMSDKISGLKGSLGSLPVWQTEHKCGNYPWLGGYQSTAPNDQAYGKESWDLIKDWINKGVTQYSAWNMILDTNGKGIDVSRDWAQNSLLTVNMSSKKLNTTQAFNVFRHASGYLDPGAKVVATSGGDALAFKNPNGSIVAVMYNSGGAKNAIVQIAGKKLQFAIPGSGWASVISQ